MAKQKGPLKLRGLVGDLSFYKTQDGYVLREKGGVTKERMKSDPKFKRTLENGSEFGRAGIAGQTFRKAFGSIVSMSKDRLMGSRLQKLMVEIQQTDNISMRGHRTVSNGNLYMLENFEFNAKSGFEKKLHEDSVVTIDRITGECSVAIPEFVPESQLMAPESATHFRFSIAAAAIDFEQGSHTVVSQDSAALPYKVQLNPQLTLSVTLPAASTLPIFVVLKVAYYQETNGQMYALYNSAFSAATVLLADVP